MDKIDLEKSIELKRLCFQAGLGLYLLSIPSFIFMRGMIAFGATGIFLVLFGCLYSEIQVGYLAVLTVPFFMALYKFFDDLKLFEIDLLKEELLDDFFISLLESKKWIVRKNGILIYAYRLDYRLKHHLYIIMKPKSAYICVLCDGPIPFDGIKKKEVINLIVNYSSYIKASKSC